MSENRKSAKLSSSPLRVLITGASGQLGRELSGLLSHCENVKPFYATHQDLDIADALSVSRFFEHNHFDYVVNCAAYTAVDKAESDADACFDVNSRGLVALAGALKDSGTRLVQISTDFVFDGNSRCPYAESDPPAPLSVYGRSKLEGENNVLRILSDVVIIRTGWLYSAHGSNFVKTILRNVLKGRSLRVVDDQIGTPTWARDLAEAIVGIITSPMWIPGIYHFSDDGIASWYDFACEICRLANVKADISPCTTPEYPVPARRPAYSVLDKTKIKQIYGVHVPQWQQSLAACLRQIDLTSL